MRWTQLAAVIGFAFVAMWIADDFGSAILCLAGAVVFAAAVAVFRGELDLGDVQQRLSQQRGSDRGG